MTVVLCWKSVKVNGLLVNVEDQMKVDITWFLVRFVVYSLEACYHMRENTAVAGWMNLQ